MRKTRDAVCRLPRREKQREERRGRKTRSKRDLLTRNVSRHLPRQRNMALLRTTGPQMCTPSCMTGSPIYRNLLHADMLKHPLTPRQTRRSIGALCRVSSLTCLYTCIVVGLPTLPRSTSTHCRPGLSISQLQRGVTHYSLLCPACGILRTDPEHRRVSVAKCRGEG